MKPKTLSVDLLVTDADTQSRVSINEDTIEEYAELIADSPEWPLGPLDVFHDGNRYLVADGFHRTMAARRTKRASIPCRVHTGTAKDARIFGMTANDHHGLRMTRADKRACVEWLLDNGGKLTQKEIAEKAGVGIRLVKMVIADRNPASIAGKATPHQLDSKGQIAPSTPSGGGSVSSEMVAVSDLIPGVEYAGEDAGTDSTGTKPQETDPRPPRNGTEKPGDSGSVVLDAINRQVPLALTGQHAAAAAILSAATKLDAVKQAVEKLSGEPGGEFLSRAKLIEGIQAIKGEISQARYWSECPRCQGQTKNKCDKCGGAGFLPFAKRGTLSADDKLYLGVD